MRAGAIAGFGRWSAVLGWMAINAYLSHQVIVPGASYVPDVLLHGVEFGVLAALVLRATSGGLGGPHTRGALIGTLLFGSLWGLLDEAHQSFIPGRDASVKDTLVDAAATALVVGIAAILGSRSRRRDRANPGAARLSERPPRVELLTRRGCGLCEEAWSVLESVLGPEGLRWRQIAIDEEPELLARFGLEVPVVRIDGVKRFRGRVDPSRLRALLEDPGRLRIPAARG